MHIRLSSNLYDLCIVSYRIISYHIISYPGAFASAVSAIVSHYPWFYTYKVLSRSKLLHNLISSNHLRNASVGFVASVVSDTFANGIRVVKITKQAIASKHTVSYWEVICMILAADGWKVSCQLVNCHC